MNLRLLSYNIRYGGVGRESALSAMIRAVDPDLVVLQEATRPEVVARLAAATGLSIWQSTRDHSVAFLSRVAVSRYEWHRPPASQRAFLEIALADSNARVFGVHLSAVHSNWMERRRKRELEALLAHVRDRPDGFHVLAGDFNTLAPGEKLDLRRLPRRLRLLALLSGRTIRWQTIQIMLDARYVDGFRSLHPQESGYTFPTWDPHVRLDYVFLPGEAAARLKRCEVVVDDSTGRAASDHFPVVAELEI